jgi:ankyrin repeat protein
MRNDWRKAAIGGDSGEIARLIEDGADIDARDRYGQTALMLAACRGRGEAVRLLLMRGAAPDVTAKYGLSALMLAAIGRHAAVARQLLAAGADTQLQGSGAPGFAGKTARDLAVDAGLAELAAEMARAAAAPPSGGTTRH